MIPIFPKEETVEQLQAIKGLQLSSRFVTLTLFTIPPSLFFAFYSINQVPRASGCRVEDMRNRDFLGKHLNALHSSPSAHLSP